MEGSLFYIICSLLTLTASAIMATVNIYNVIKKPAQKYKEKQDAEFREKICATLKEVLPEILTEHDKEVRERYLADRERYLHDIESAVLKDINGKLTQIEKLTDYYEVLIVTAKDVLREKIVTIYLNNKNDKSMTVLERERLDQFYKDYKALNGNTYIDKYYKRMKKWETVEEDCSDDDDVI